MNKLMRLIKHRLWDETDAARALRPDALARIEARVRESEQHHTGEICVCVEASLPVSYLWRDATARERAIAQFSKLKVWDTEANNGVLIYLLLVERKVEIVADRGLNAHVSAAQWQSLLNTMRADFQAGRFEAGLLAAVNQVDQLLRTVCPLPAGDRPVNEMSDAVRLA